MECMYGWMYVWMDGCMSVCLSVCMDVWLCMYACMHACLSNALRWILSGLLLLLRFGYCLSLLLLLLPQGSWAGHQWRASHTHTPKYTCGIKIGCSLPKSTALWLVIKHMLDPVLATGKWYGIGWVKMEDPAISFSSSCVWAIHHI